VEPAAKSFDEVWSRVLEAAASSRREPAAVRLVEAGRQGRIAVGAAAPTRRLRLWLAPLAAAAAALLLAFGPGLARRGFQPAGPDSRPDVPVALASFEAEPGETLFIEISGRTATSTSLPPSEISDTVTVAAELDIFNFMESQDSL
jgi:hypothetical protein